MYILDVTLRYTGWRQANYGLVGAELNDQDVACARKKTQVVVPIGAFIPIEAQLYLLVLTGGCKWGISHILRNACAAQRACCQHPLKTLC